MPTPFDRSLNALEQDRPGRWYLRLAVGAAVMGAWIGWALLARVSVYAQSSAARLQVERYVHAIEPTVAGRVVDSRLHVGAEVREGDVLVQLDATEETLRLDEDRARILGLTPQIESRRRELQAEQDAERTATGQQPLAVTEARAHLEEAEIAVRKLEVSLERTRTLFASGSASKEQVDTETAEVERQRRELEARRAAFERLGGEQRTATSERRARIERVVNELAQAEAEERVLTAAVARLEHDIAEHELRASVSGRIAEVVELPAGIMVSAGQRLGAIVPTGGVRLVADFAPAEAMGRIRPGQRALFRLDGFSWTQYGALEAVVRDVATEPRDALVRVELEVDPASARVPLEHGLPGRAEIEIERVSPATLVLRAAGAMMQPRESGR
jgi:membrane fusion protein (multidrug efflux system)